MDKKTMIYILPALFVGIVIYFSIQFTSPKLLDIPLRLEMPQEEPPVLQKEIIAEKETEKEEKEGNYNDGVYKGSAQGYGGPVKVEVTVGNSQISEIKVLEASKETPSFLNRAMAVVDNIIKEQTWEVDAVSGATYSSRGIMGAVKNALTGEVVENKPPKTPQGKSGKDEKYEKPKAYKDGTYKGKAYGFGGYITVKVTIEDGTINSIDVVSAPGETKSYFKSAKKIIKTMLKKQTPNVDTISGATYSSRGIKNAVIDALKKAATEKVDEIPDGSDEPDETEKTEEPEETKEPEEQKEPKESKELENDKEVVYKDGIYKGSAKGYNKKVPIVVEVTIKKGKLSKVKVVSHGETPQFFAKTEDLPNQIVKKQSPNVDVVSGATYSSKGIMAAVSNALLKAAKNPDKVPKTDPESNLEENPKENPGQEPEENPEKGPEENPEQEPEEIPGQEQETEPEQGKVLGKFLEGTYEINNIACYCQAVFDYDISLKVVVDENGCLKAITGYISNDYTEESFPWNYAEDNVPFFEAALAGIKEQAIKKQGVDNVDVVSGATYSSNAIIGALKATLSEIAVTKGE